MILMEYIQVVDPNNKYDKKYHIHRKVINSTLKNFFIIKKFFFNKTSSSPFPQPSQTVQPRQRQPRLIRVILNLKKIKILF
jgi:hypothetical protein